LIVSKLLAIFVLEIMAEFGIPFPVDGSIAEQNSRHHSVPGWRFSYSPCRNFPFFMLRSEVIQEFDAFEVVKKFFSILGGKYDR
jgi:hypothetical protein